MASLNVFMRCGNKNCIVAFSVKQWLGERTTMFSIRILPVLFSVHTNARVSSDCQVFDYRNIELLDVTVLVPTIWRWCIHLSGPGVA